MIILYYDGLDGEGYGDDDDDGENNLLSLYQKDLKCHLSYCLISTYSSRYNVRGILEWRLLDH